MGDVRPCGRVLQLRQCEREREHGRSDALLEVELARLGQRQSWWLREMQRETEVELGRTRRRARPLALELWWRVSGLEEGELASAARQSGRAGP
jgi:hypothetical protein